MVFLFESFAVDVNVHRDFLDIFATEESADIEFLKNDVAFILRVVDVVDVAHVEFRLDVAQRGCHVKIRNDRLHCNLCFPTNIELSDFFERTRQFRAQNIRKQFHQIVIIGRYFLESPVHVKKLLAVAEKGFFEIDIAHNLRVLAVDEAHLARRQIIERSGDMRPQSEILVLPHFLVEIPDIIR